ncbi:hypothetical protein C8E03_11919 [Lachnotalea glycerini]|uniref:Uncharacterized protein n=1 Tax=Lachnotalea glycerini TaxID=1763509 RepID=A0A318EGL6_9FIRM|nr:hypothetical protein [Lachnotalea glycerini]PXV85095.1 hypothetical protein C8E03_11919 [Lachnotalea glycerini]
MDVIGKAMEQSRKAIEKFYKGTCNVYERQNVTDADIHITKKQEVLVLENQPCKLSFTSLKATDMQGGAATVTQTPKLFIAPEINIKPGSKIEVTQNNATKLYQRSGESGKFTTHQEIVLELFAKYA